MGIRFLCHNCENRLNVKKTQAGQEGECPHCMTTVMVPKKSTIPSKRVKENQPRRRPSHSESDDSFIELLNAEQETIVGTPAEEAAAQAAANGTNGSISGITSKRNKPKKKARKQISSEIIRRPIQANDPFMLDKPALPDSMGTADPFANAENKVWYFRNREIGEKGPLKSKEMKEYLEKGDIDVGTIIWREDWEDWILSEKVFPTLAAKAKAIRQQKMVKRAHEDANYTIPDEFNPHSRLNRRRRRNKRIFMGAIALGIIVIGFLVYVLVKLLSK